jgi:predicted alpha-1,2-mannosidase
MHLSGRSRPAPRRGRAALLALVTGAAVSLAAVTAADPAAAAADDPASLVDPLVGSANQGETFPGADTPYGMVQWSPENSCGNQTRTCQPGGYDHGSDTIRGFSLTHMSGTGCAGGYGDIPFLPYVGAVNSSPSADVSDARYVGKFSHDDEVAEAGYYKVKFGSGVTTELSATARTGAGRFSYPAGKTASLLVRTSNSEVGSSDAKISVDTARHAITGSVTSGNFCGYINTETRKSYYTVYFAAEFDQPFTGTGSWQDGTRTANGTTASGGTGYGDDGWPVEGKGSGAYVRFASGQTVNVRVGISFVSAANAQANLTAENPAGTDFDTVRQRAHDAWNTALGRVRITGGSDTEQRVFYTALYHSLLHPNLFSDVNGQYTGMDQKVHKVTGSQKAQYANFSGWDVYRSQLQLVTLLQPDVGGDIAQSLFNQAKQHNGVWDRWTHAQGGTHVMTGDPAHSSLASIYAFGGTNFDVKGALASMVHAATTVTKEDLSRDGWNVMVVGERPSLDRYLSIHYVPSDGNAWGGAGETLEDVTADFGISQLAARTGDTATSAAFLARAQYWRNVFHPTRKYIQERNSAGAWQKFDPKSDDGFAEGSSAQYTWMVPFNARGLFDAMGGNAAANARLDRFFHHSDGSWALKGGDGSTADVSNEPSLNSPWLYNYSGQPYKTQATVRETLNTLWKDGPDGIPGQDDLGEMSSWYAFAAMGLYPQAPGRADLVLAAPLFQQVVIQRSNGRTITLNAPQAATDRGYLQGVKVDGAATTRPWVPESFVANGGTLDFAVSATANTSWGSAAGDAPPSFDVGARQP